jgi:histidinol-phosphate/aromatic aminotransferase/cobyric acid decarboxylase-like protein
LTAPADLRLHGDAFARDGLLDYAVNIGRGRTQTLQAALVEALADERYPDDRQAPAAIAVRHGVAVDRALALNGACEGFWLLAQSLRPRRAVCIHPTFSEGEAALRAAGANVEQVVLRPPTWELDPDQVAEEADFVVVTNPNNPTGHLERAATLAALARPGRLLLVDESFMDFARERESLAARLELPGLVVLRSCTKLWSLAGIRAGYLLAEPPLAARLARQRQPWSVNALACAALCYAARERETAERLVSVAECSRLDLARRLEAIPGVRIFPSVTNFLLVEARGRGDVPDDLRARGIAVRPVGDFPGLGDSFFRVAVRDVSDNQRLAHALRAVMDDA